MSQACPEPFDSANPQHLHALESVAAEGVAALRGTPGVIRALRDKHGVAANENIAFECLLKAANLDE